MDWYIKEDANMVGNCTSINSCHDFLLMALIIMLKKLSYVACRMFDYCDCCPKAMKKVGLHGILKAFDFDCAIV